MTDQLQEDLEKFETLTLKTLQSMGKALNLLADGLVELQDRVRVLEKAQALREDVG